MRTVTMLIGLPGSGKTYYAKGMSGTYVSLDEIRKELYGDISEQGNPAEVVNIADTRIKTAIENDCDVIYDATNVSFRNKTIKKFRDFGAEKVNGIFVNTPYEVCCTRNKHRTDRNVPVPNEVMQKMYEKLERWKGDMLGSDGFDMLLMVNN